MPPGFVREDFSLSLLSLSLSLCLTPSLFHSLSLSLFSFSLNPSLSLSPPPSPSLSLSLSLSAPESVATTPRCIYEREETKEKKRASSSVRESPSSLSLFFFSGTMGVSLTLPCKLL